MFTLTLIMEKGGSGKSTLAKNLAVAAEEEGLRTLIVDLDPQRSAEAWYQRREADTPALVAIEPLDIGKALAAAREKAFDLVAIDTPGRDQPGLRAAVAASTFCLVPCRSAVSDVEVVARTATFIAAQNTPVGFVISQAPARGARIDEAKRALAHFGPVCPTAIVSRAVYWDADIEGRGVTEFEPSGRAADETRTLWRWIKAKMEKVA